MKLTRTLLTVVFALGALASCTREIQVEIESLAPKTKISFQAQGEADATGSKVILDFSQTPNVRWADDDLIAVFDGKAKNQFSIVPGSNTGATATFSGDVTAGYTKLFAVYPFSAAKSLSGSTLSVTVPSVQTVGGGSVVDPAALVSVGQVSNQSTEFRQVCGLLKFEITSAGISQVVIQGTNLAGTATVSALGVLSGVTSGENTVVISSTDGTFANGTYYAAVLPGTTAAEIFTVSFVESTGLAHTRIAGSAVTVVRRECRTIGSLDGSYTDCRHIVTKAQLFAWGEAMAADESALPVYLDADIDCGGDKWTFTGTTFHGRFYGQNHKIYNMVVETSTQTGLIYTFDGIMKDLVFGSSNGTSWDNKSRITHKGTGGAIEYVGLVCRLTGKGNMENVKNFAKVEVPSSSNSRAYVGGLVGVIPGTATGATMADCKNYGSVTNASTWTGGETRMGGIIGQCDGALLGSGLENHGAIKVSNSVTNFVGGLCGDLASGSAVSSCSNYGTITFTDSGTQNTYLGGCFGSVRGNPATTVSNCHNYAAITASRSALHWFGGIAGFMQSGNTTVTDCVNHAGANLDVAPSVSARVLMGGITGGCQYNGDGPFGVIIQDCRNEAAISNHGTATDFGGIAGLLDNYLASATVLIQNCENAGAVSGEVSDNGTSMNRELRIGGIVGGTDPESAGCDQVIRSCVNNGAVTAKGALKSGASVRLGGIVGNTYANTKIDKCKNFGDVGFPNAGENAGSAVFYCGGIVGGILGRTSSRYQSFSDCINTGSISSARAYNNQYLGGILGGGSNEDAYPVVSGCKNYGTVSATKTTNTLVGGLCGYTCFNLVDNSNFGNVDGGEFHGAVYGDNNAKSTSSGTKVGDGVTVGGVAAPAQGTYEFGTGAQTGKDWFVGWNGNSAISVTIVGQESYSGSTSPEESGPGGYLFAYTGKGEGRYYRMYYGISQDGITWSELNGGESPMPTYYGFPYITQDNTGTFWLIGISNTTPRYPIVWKSDDMISWAVVKSIPRSVFAVPSGYENDTNSFGALKMFFDPVSKQFIITWHAGEADKSDDAYWESMRTFYVLTSDFETFTPAQKLFAFTGSDANMAQIDATIHYYGGKYYALIKDERTYHSSSNYYKRPRIAVSNSLTGPYGNPGGALTPKHREAPTMVQSPDKAYWYLYVENYEDGNYYELYRSTSLTASGWSKVSAFTPPSTTNCRHGCVVPIDAKTYRRLQAAF